MKVRDLKQMLQNWLEDLDWYDEDNEVKLSANTYRMGNEFIATYNGFIDMNDPVKDSEEEDW